MTHRRGAIVTSWTSSDATLHTLLVCRIAAHLVDLAFSSIHTVVLRTVVSALTASE